ncbi:MAG TPA: dTDP-4-dehydrorhamnose 3,5-epimerase [Thermoanaerobaculia bacterium]|nr:dTDP-4-dehydrorhamnose 3,5-epimerase [Thermoanaerobaculia bacterium]
MRLLETPLPGVLIVEPRVFSDPRGFFMETYNAARFAEKGLGLAFVQDNHSRSSYGVLRGLHYQEPNAQGKLVRVSHGSIFDVALDIRKGSPTFGQWFGVELSEDNKLQLWVPPGFAHGFCVTSERADLIYKCTALYDPPSERAILWNDPALGIEWPVSDPILSDKDRAAPALAAAAMLPEFE